MESLTATKPKLGFSGVGWIGKNRLRAIKEEQSAEIKAAVDPDTTAIEELEQEIDGLHQFESFEEMLREDIDGVVIASPSAMHAEQAFMALDKGKAVFCQKPLGRNKEETSNVVNMARCNDLLLGVDFSYRYTEGAKEVKRVVQSGELGNIYGVQLKFHNAYGPDKSWYYDASQSGGGCLMDLGIHLIDLLFWILDENEIHNANGQMFQKSNLLIENQQEVEDYAAAQFSVDNDVSVQLSCSWNLPAGKNAIIEAAFYGERGGVAFRNVKGSFYDFIAERYSGTSTKILASPPDDWEGRAAVKWGDQLAEGNNYDPAAERYVDVAHALDLLYQKCSQ